MLRKSMTPKQYWRDSMRLAIQAVRENRLPRECLSYFWRAYRRARWAL